MKTLVMSIKPKFSRRIFAGTKRFELRRAPINAEAGDVVVVYESAPSKAVVGAFVVGGTYRGSASSLWAELGPELGVSQDEYWAYFDGAKMAQAIAVERPFEVPPVPLEELRRRFHGFHPPQSYRFWNAALGGLLGGAGAAAIRDGQQ